MLVWAAVAVFVLWSVSSSENDLPAMCRLSRAGAWVGEFPGSPQACWAIVQIQWVIDIQHHT